MTDFQTTLKHLREDAGISQAKLARAACCDHTHISRLESGQRRPDREMVERIAKALNTDPDVLMRAAGYLTPAMGRFLDKEYFGSNQP